MKNIVSILFILILLSTVCRLYAMTLPILQSDDSLWFATKDGLYKYNKTQNEWSFFSSKNGLASDEIRDIGIDEGLIWVVTDRGISNSDVRFSDWRSFSDKLPSQNTTCVAFSRDYVWIGTDKGISRFDKLLEEWKDYVLPSVNDIVIVSETAWIATSDGIFRLDIDYDKITQIDINLPSKNIIKAISIGDFIWFITDLGIVRYEKKLNSWKTYGLSDGIVSYDINDIIIDGSKIWLATSNGISIYDSVSDSWSEGTIYHNLLPSKNIKSLAIDGDNIWFLTEKGTSLYNNKTGSWRHFNSNNGLLDNSGQGIIVSGSVFVVTEKGINIYDKKIQDWDNYKFQDKDQIGKKGEKWFQLDDKGIGFSASDETQFRLSGISSFEYYNSIEISPKRKSDPTYDSKNDINLRGTMPNNRSITGFYNDLREDNIDYGLAYRGNEADIIFEGRGGKFRADWRNAELIESINLLGGDIHLRKKVRNIRANLQPRYGKSIGNYESEFFQYKVGTSIYQLNQTDILPDTETVIAGMEILQRGIDYVMVYPNGWLMFPQEELLDDGEYIEVRYQYKLKDDSEKNMVTMVTTGIDIGGDHYIGMDTLILDDFDVISLNNESKNVKIGELSMKIKPEIAYARLVDDRSFDIDHLASRAEITAVAPKTQLKVDYSKFGDDFYTFGMPKTRFGDVQQHIGTFSQFDVFQWLPIKLYWQNDRSKSNSSSINENFAKLNAVLSKPKYPVIALTGKGKWTDDVNENSIRTDIQYSLPDFMLSHMKIRRAEFNSYYYQSDRDDIEDNQVKTSYFKVNLNPIERFDISTSYKLNKTVDDELKRFLFKSNLASIKGTMLDLYYDDSNLVNNRENKNINNTYLTTGLGLIPGLWTSKLKLLTISSRYSLLDQTIPISEGRYNDSKSRSLRVQTSLTPYNWVMFVGTYDGLKSWIDTQNIIPKYDNNYRAEMELNPNLKLRLLLEYDQENETEGEIKKRSYLPSALCETRISKNWTIKIRNSYYKYSTDKNYEKIEAGSSIVPSLSLRYINNELSHGGRLYVTQSFSISFDHAERDVKELRSRTYVTGIIMDWRIIRNFSLRFNASISYEDAQSIGETDKTLCEIYMRLLAKF